MFLERFNLYHCSYCLVQSIQIRNVLKVLGISNKESKGDFVNNVYVTNYLT